jgi:cell division protein FtsW
MPTKLAFDKVLFTTVVLLLFFGLVMVYSASSAFVAGQGISQFLVKQSVAAGLGLILMVCLMHVDYRKLRNPLVVYGLLFGVLGLLVAVLFAPPLNATRRWLFVGGVSVQPSEIAKLAVVLFLAYLIERRGEQVNDPKFLVPAGVVVALVAALIYQEPDLGTAVLLAASAFLMTFLAGLSWRFMIPLAGVVPVVLGALVMAEEYRRQRLFAFFDPEKDPLGSGFQALQSLIAVGSGGVFGLGPGRSVQKMYFLPHPESDFVFSIVAEELGMIGAVLVLAAFAVLAWRGARAGLKAPDAFGRYLGWGFSGLLVMQALLNVSVAVALLPTKGMALPFISYGGSSLVVTLAICGVLLNVSQHG